jgi:hypothetical protein
MRPRGIVMRSSRRSTHSDGMDVVAVVIGIAMFAILIVLIEGIDRV